MKKSQFNIVADANIPLVTELFSPYGSVTLFEGRDITHEMLHETDVLLVRSVTQVNRQLLEGTPIQFVGTATIGIDHIDCDYLSEANIQFASAPGCNANSVAEYVIAALAQTQRLKSLIQDQQRLGIVGFGNVGKKLYQLACKLGIETFCYDPFVAEQSELLSGNLGQNNEMPYPEFVSWGEVINSDVISLHVPLTTDGKYPTYHLMDPVQLSRLKQGCLLINTSRGAVVDNKALYQAIFQRKIKAVLDVWESEPDLSLELRDLCEISTPHIAGYSQDGKVMGTKMLLRAFETYINSMYPNNASLKESTLTEVCLNKAIDDEKKGASFKSTQLHDSEDLKLDWDPEKDFFENITALILKAYPIEEDCRNLCAISGDSIPSKFDKLRKNYPIRKEFRHWIVRGVMEQNQCQFLGQLGFCYEGENLK